MKKLIILAIILLSELPSFAQPFQEQLIWQNRTRRFITFLPDAYEADNPDVSLPLVINMHPFLTDGPFQMRYTRFNGIANQEDVIVVYPYGIRGRWNSGSFFGVEYEIDDLGFLNALIDYMAVLYNVDTRRVYATGYSNGGYMSYTLACELTNRIAAIAPVAATMNPDLIPICNPDRPIPVLVFNGTEDALVEYNGSEVGGGIEDVVALWGGLNNCDPVPAEEDVPNISTTDNTTSVKFSYTNCADDVEVILYKIINGGHTWPGRNFPLLGNTSQDVIANELIWEFFDRYSIPDDVACERPSGLSVDFDGSTASLAWNEIPGIDFYSLLHFQPGGDLELVQSISANSHVLENVSEGELRWAVRAQCESGHVSWSTINREDLAGRFSSGRLALFTYPNPAVDLLHIEFHKEHLPESISIINAFGHAIRTIGVQDEYLTIDISVLKNGIYHIISNDQSYASHTIRKW